MAFVSLTSGRCEQVRPSCPPEYREKKGPVSFVRGLKKRPLNQLLPPLWHPYRLACQRVFSRVVDGGRERHRQRSEVLHLLRE